ncbi:tetratricopeptide repeat protein [Shewanella xiamenensis]|uniref:tetratricopeptide repeat protein n=1 Tax=Shewanella xiamenensis TaxID=332186 RepID=UPI00214F7723|nr:tetratricopeptide repeat protein [Shewanella xiamenensis]MCR4534978.1 tetratricopeptide repeat protein [Shewanella xiamenensis]WHF54833.1 tetratricopeptide repeat protein [Shewanella xiamenensis]
MRHKSNSLPAKAIPRWKTKLKQTSLIGLSLFSPVLLACGPDFPLQLTQDRQNNLSYLPQTSFSQQLSGLAKPLAWQFQGAPAAQEYLWDEAHSRYLSQTRAYENSELSEAQLAQVNSLRDAQSLAEAEQIAAQLKDALPSALTWYSLGAMAFDAKEYDKASDYFKKVIALPETERAGRSLWALYSLSRIELIKSKTANDNSHFVQANAYLQQLQTEVTQGAADPLRLSLAGLGEQAYILLHQGQAQIEVTRGEYEPPKIDVALNPATLDKIIELYATQSAEGDSSGYDSLLMLSRTLMAKNLLELKPLLQQPSVQQLLIAYWQSSANDFAFDGQLTEMGQQVAKILTIFPTDGLMLSQGDKLAAIYYQLGDYASAERLIALAKPSGLTWWLTAKLMMQKGDQAQAAKAYAEAVRHFPTDMNAATATTSQQDAQQQAIEADAEQATYCRIRAEQGVLSLERGEYVDALNQLFASGDEYWQDIAYVAERVLTTAELKLFIDEHVPVMNFEYPKDSDWYDSVEPLNNRLRYLLGRRLLRESAIAEAPAYFSNPTLNANVQEYGEALTTAKSSKGIESARAYWTAAELARHQGMEILGFELAPDYSIYAGMFDLRDWYAADKLSDKELQRVSASQAIPDKRFHYRYQAAELASKAADLVPHNSQAYAALLCQATGWVLYRDDELAQRYYKKYVANGPFVPWAENFGTQCETPDFDRAVEREKANQIAEWNAIYHKLKKPVAVSFAIIAALLGAYAWRRRKRKQ